MHLADHLQQCVVYLLICIVRVCRAYRPLLRSRLLRARYGLQPVTKDLAGNCWKRRQKKIQVCPKDNKLYQALWYTHLRPAPMQEKAAGLLVLPFSTYRYHLSKGIERVTE